MTCSTCIPRGAMPQVDEADIPALLDFVREQGVSVKEVTVNPRDVRGRQRVDRRKVRLMPETLLGKPILISGDNLVLDGNHRWMAAVWRKCANLPAWQFGCDFATLVALLLRFPKAYSYGDGKFHPIQN